MKGARGGALLALPYVVGLGVLVVVPACVTFSLALTDYNLLESPRWVGGDNFRELAEDPIFRIALRNSLLFVLVAVPLRVLAAVGLALLLHRRFRAANAARTSVFLPSVLPDMAYALVWLWILNPVYGPLNLLLRSAGIPAPHWFTDPRDAQTAIVLLSTFLIAEGFVVALAAGALVPTHLYELAAVEGASAVYVLRRVTLPLMAPAIVLLTLRDTILSFQITFVPALVIYGGGPPPYATTQVPLFVYRHAFEYLRYGYAAAASVVAFALTALVVYNQFLVLRRWRTALWPDSSAG